MFKDFVQKMNVFSVQIFFYQNEHIFCTDICYQNEHM